MRDINHAYRDEPALWELDHDPAGFWWIEANAAEDNVVAFARRSADGQRFIVVVANLAPVPRPGYRLGFPTSGAWLEAVNTDAEVYGGSGVGNLGRVEAEPVGWHGQPFSAEVTLPPLGTLWVMSEPPRAVR